MDGLLEALSWMIYAFTTGVIAAAILALIGIYPITIHRTTMIFTKQASEHYKKEWGLEIGEDPEAEEEA